MIHEGKNNTGGTAINKALVVDKAVQMSEEKGINMLRAVGFIASDEGYVVRDLIIITLHIRHWPT